MRFLFRKPTLTAVSIFFVVPLGLYSKYYQGIGSIWLNDYGAAIWYEVFWCLLAFYFFSNKKAVKFIPIYVFIVTCLLEILQLWNPFILTLIRSHIVGKLLLGTTFSWWDFPHYIIGCLLGWLWLEFINKLNYNSWQPDK
ncbi:ribosomal maturation YjgA family protein [Crocosphaera sp. Alani8]|uniref:ribosomal maturation YjgA family protein n=1 Tax=Crocosphaera sp. Alani8 TaxID=3038952 RepID=UPI00313AB834